MKKNKINRAYTKEIPGDTYSEYTVVTSIPLGKNAQTLSTSGDQSEERRLLRNRRQTRKPDYESN